MTAPATPGVTRHYVTLGRRQVHYRRAGTGPPLLALHGLPRSSVDMVPFLQEGRDRFTVIAPDQAGYGNSFPLDEAATDLVPYCGDLAAFLDALGLNRVLLYGERAGATLATAFALHAPSRVAALAGWDPEGPGFPDWPSEVHDLPPFEPKWDGSHLAWLWAMLREQHAFHPWQAPSLATRVDADMPSPGRLQDLVVQFLTGDQRGRAYGAGLKVLHAFDAGTALKSLACPALMVARRRHGDDDPWRNKETANTVRCEAAPEHEGGRGAALAFLAGHRFETAVPPPPPPVPIQGRLWHGFADVEGGQLHFECNGDADTVPLLVQHDAASSIDIVRRVTQSFIGKRKVFAFDMPGSGESDRTIPDEGVAVKDYADVLAQALDHLGLKQVVFYGMWGGGFVGLELARHCFGRVRRLVMSNVFQHDGAEQAEIVANYTPDVSPVWHGGHLLQCWHQMRDQGIYYPWFHQNRKGVIWREPYLATDMVHERVCALLKAGNMYRTAYRSHFVYPTYNALADTPVPTLLATTTWDPNNPHTLAAAEAAPNCSFQYLHDDMAHWGESFLPFLTAEAP